ncbi:MAG: histidine kinase dimerization/phosphoacceptor domain -containing protein [Thermodesulfobacteriota bacterium]
MKIREKLAFASLSVAILSIVILSILVFITVKDNLESEIKSKIHLAVEEKESQLITLLETQLANLQYLAQDPTIVKLTAVMVNVYGTSSKTEQQNAYRELKEYLTNFADFYGGPGLEGGAYADVMVADLAGYMWIGTYGPDEGGNEAGRVWFKQAMQGIYLGNISYNPTMRQSTQIAAMPIKDNTGTVLAVLQLETNINAINKILQHREGLGRTGELYIVGKGNVMLSRSRFDPGAQGKLIVDTFAINQAVEKKADIMPSHYKNYRGKFVVGSVHVFSHSLEIRDEKIRGLLTNLDWLIVGETEEAEAHLPLIKLRNRIIYIGFIVSMLIVLISLIISRSISAPIKILKEATHRIARGQLDERVKVRSRDELGDLAESFNRMTDELQETTVSRDMLSTEVEERKLTQDVLKNTLAEKEVLMKEIHHRVKNNLQVVSSLLSLESSHAQRGSKDPQEIFKQSQDRISSMSLVHELLYQSGDISNISLPEYFKILTENIFKSYAYSPSKVNLKMNIEEIKLDIDTSITLGLILTELCTNVLKYAFPEGAHGELKIDFMRAENSNYLLVVSDNGVGLPVGFDTGKSTGMGFILVKSLVKQLGGSLEIESAKGASFKLTFPL